MKLARTWLVGISLAALTGAPAFAGEDSTHRYDGFGPEYQNYSCGLACFAPPTTDVRLTPDQP